MRKLTLTAIAALSLSLVTWMAFSSTGYTCDSAKKTASVETASAEKASASSCSAKKASRTASTHKSCTAKNVKTASTGATCTSKSVKTVSAGSGCSYSAEKVAMMREMNIETTRLPSGAMLVFYTSDKPEIVQALQKTSADGAESFSCLVCKKIAADANCTVELASLDNGVVALVTAEEPSAVDTYEAEFAALLPADE